jgi:hypothetical protein
LSGESCPITTVQSPVVSVASPTSLTAHVTCRSHLIDTKHLDMQQENLLRVQVEPMEVMVDRPLNLLLERPTGPTYATL